MLKHASHSALVERFGRLAGEALLLEARAHPKPGLVTPLSRGSHSDMSIETLEASARAIQGAFGMLPGTCCELLRKGDLGRAAPILKSAGQAAENAMFRATGGVNAHKGAIFTLLCVFAGSVLASAEPMAALDGTARLVEHLPHLLVPCASQAPTTGQKALSVFGLGGLRAEARSGYPTIRRNYGAFVDEWRTVDSNHALVANLVRNMVSCQDTTLLNRKFDLDALGYVQTQAQRLLAVQQASVFMEGVEHLDRAFVARDISPGGAADLTAATAFLALWFEDIENE